MLKRIICAIAVCLLALLVSACGKNGSGMVETPADMSMQRGRNYREVIEDFEDKGFTNIVTEKIEDLEYGRTFRNGHVETITVGGDSDYETGTMIPEDTEVVIRYHTYNPNTIKNEGASDNSP